MDICIRVPVSGFSNHTKILNKIQERYTASGKLVISNDDYSFYSEILVSSSEKGVSEMIKELIKPYLIDSSRLRIDVCIQENRYKITL